jgi:CRISPR-associated protein Cmr4
MGPEAITDLFGREVDSDAPGAGLQAGRLCFTEARLLAYPVRSLNRPFLHVTCPLILEAFDRDLRAVGAAEMLKIALPPRGQRDRALVADDALAQDTLVIEDLVYRAVDVVPFAPLKELSNALSRLIPRDEAATRDRFQSGLVIIPDNDFSALMDYVVPVRARIKLTGGKTTDKWVDPDSGRQETGNLWYEEYVPSDCLFVSFIGERRSRQVGPGAKAADRRVGLRDLANARDSFQVIQVGGNETVGNGLCRCELIYADGDPQ